MSGLRPLIAIKAGKCTQSGSRIIPNPEPGLLYLYNSPDDDLLHFCWRHRAAQEPEDDLIIFPSEATFVPYTACTTGRVFVLKFSSSSQRHFFWLQNRAESDTNMGYWSARDRRWGTDIDRFLQGGEGEEGDEEEDEEMGDLDAELGSEDIEEEGSASRRGGEDGGRAPFATTTTTSSSSNDFLKSLISSINVSSQPQHQYSAPTPTTSLTDLLSTPTTLPVLSALTPSALAALLSNLPPALIPAGATDAQKRDVVRRVLMSPQFAQSCVGLSVALRDGALRGVADSLQVRLGPVGPAADMVECFVDGVRRGVEGEQQGEQGGDMEVD